MELAGSTRKPSITHYIFCCTQYNTPMPRLQVKFTVFLQSKPAFFRAFFLQPTWNRLPQWGPTSTGHDASLSPFSTPPTVLPARFSQDISNPKSSQIGLFCWEPPVSTTAKGFFFGFDVSNLLRTSMRKNVFKMLGRETGKNALPTQKMQSNWGLQN